MVKAVTPWPGDSFQLYLARMIENAEMATPEHRERYGIETRRVLIASFHREGSGGPVPEVEEIVVGTSAMPVADWRRSFMPLGAMATARMRRWCSARRAAGVMRQASRGAATS